MLKLSGITHAVISHVNTTLLAIYMEIHRSITLCTLVIHPSTLRGELARKEVSLRINNMDYKGSNQ
jgi:hypothetical protein